MKSDNLKELFKKAADIASEVPESMQPIAFSRALEIILKETADIKIETKTKQKKVQVARKTVKRKGDEQVEKLLNEIDRTKYSIIDKLNITLDRSLLVLKIAKEEFDIDGLTPPQIAKILTDKFRVKTSRQAADMALKKAGKFVDRVPTGRKAFKYRIMQPGEEYLSKIISEKEEKK